MPFHPSRHRPISWFAIALLLFTSLSPMFKTSGGSGSAKVEMCSSHGHAMSPVATSADGPTRPSASHDDGWCKLHCSLLQPASSSMAPSVARNGVLHLPTQQPNAPRPARTWPGALSRAPPRSA